MKHKYEHGMALGCSIVHNLWKKKNSKISILEELELFVHNLVLLCLKFVKMKNFLAFRRKSNTHTYICTYIQTHIYIYTHSYSYKKSFISSTKISDKPHIKMKFTHNIGKEQKIQWALFTSLYNWNLHVCSLNPQKPGIVRASQ